MKTRGARPAAARWPLSSSPSCSTCSRSAWAQAGGKFCRQRYRQCGANLRPVRHRLGGDAVSVLADTRRPLGPVRPPPRGAIVEFRARARLCADGAGAVADLALCRQGDLGDHLGKRLDGVRLHRGADAPKERAAVFGKIGVAFGAGFILGPAVGGLLGGMDPRLPFWVAAGLSFANTLYGLLILPESLPPDRRSPFRWRSANPLGALHLLRSDPVLTGLSVTNFLAQLAHVVLPSTFVLYATYRYGWNTTTVGLTLALVGICSMAVQGAAIGPIVKRFGERRALLLGLASGAAGFLIYGAAPTGPLFWLGIPVMALWGVAGAAIQALMTQLVAPDQQGQLQGATSSVQSLSQMLGPFLFTLTFAYFIGAQAPLKLPGAPFLLASALLLLALVIAARTLADRGTSKATGSR